MENHPHTVPFTTGKLVLHSPCSVGKEAFTPQEGGNKFCSQCQKTVHDMTRLNEDEIKALFATNGGKVCGSIRVRVPKPMVQPEPEPTPKYTFRKPLYLKQLAAAASFMLLYQTSTAKLPSKPAITWHDPRTAGGNDIPGNDAPWKNNTLVTGVIINQDSVEVPLDIPVLIYANKKLIREVTSSHGLFHCDLGDQLKPDAIIEIVIRKHTAGKNAIEDATYGDGKAVSKLADAQNIRIKIDYEFPWEDMQVDGGLGWEEPIDIQEPELPTVDSDAKSDQ